MVAVSKAEDLTKLRAETEKVQALKEALVSRLPQKRRPRLILFDVSNDIKKDALIPTLKEQNSLSLEPGQLSVKFPMKGKGGLTNLVLEAEPGLHKKLTGSGKLNVGWARCRVRDYVAVTRCYKCYAFGHIAKNCTSAVQVCSRCGQEHSHKECKAEATRCVNCARANKRFRLRLEEGHSCMSANCPSYKRELEIVRARTAYDGR